MKFAAVVGNHTNLSGKLWYFVEMNTVQQWLNDRSMRLGLVVGLIGLGLSFAGRGLNLGRELGDPLPVVLVLSQALRGSLLYLNWQGVGWHLLFLLFLVVIIVGIIYLWLPKDQRQQISIRSAVRFAVILNIAVVAITEVDAFVVGFWYLMGSFVSIFLAGVLADGAAKLMNR